MRTKQTDNKMHQSQTVRFRAMTLIELLVVVAIIAILAAIGAVNYLHAQTRAKVARVKADLRTIATAIESYATDYHSYPLDITGADGHSEGDKNFWYISHSLSTPVAYIAQNWFVDPFRVSVNGYQPQYHRCRYVNYRLGEQHHARKTIPDKTLQSYRNGSAVYGEWRVSFSGPDRKAGPWSPVQTWSDSEASFHYFPQVLVLYDPTNGAVSNGDIVRSQSNPEMKQTHYEL